MGQEPPVYVYGIVRAGHVLPEGCLGVGAPPAAPWLLPAGRLAAVVSEAPDRLRARRRDLLSHQEVLLTLAEDGPVLPMRFGVVSPGESAVAAQLAAAEDSHLSTLSRLDGHLEMNVKVFPTEDGLADLLREDTRLQRLRAAVRRRPDYESSVRLGEAVAAGLQRWARAVAARALRVLAPLAAATAVGPEVPGCVTNTSFLVARSTTDRFRAAGERCAAEAQGRAELRVTGPLPAFSFVAAPARTAGVSRAGAG